MYPVSAEYLTTIRGDHTKRLRGEVWQNGVKALDVNPTGGSVTADFTRPIQRTMDCTLIDGAGTLTPSDLFDPINPVSSELWLYRGVLIPSKGTYEEVPLGKYLITDVDISETAEGVEIGLSGEDRSRRIARNKFADPYQIAAGIAIDQAITTLLADRWPSVEVDLTPTTYVTASTYLTAGESSNPWQDAIDLALTIGYVLYFDADGVVRWSPPVDPTTAIAVQSYTDSDAVVTGLDRKLVGSEVFNGVIVTGEGSTMSTPARGEAWDADVLSPTYYLGPFGKAPMFMNSSTILTNDQATAAATAQLNQILGIAEQVEWTQIQNDALAPNDVVNLARSTSKVSGGFVLDVITYPLDTAPISAVARSRRAGGAGG